jgi:hypothetical protein
MSICHIYVGIYMSVCIYAKLTYLIEGKIMAGEEVRTTWRMPKSLIKQLKQYALDHDTTLTAIAIEAFQEFLQRKRKDKI